MMRGTLRFFGWSLVVSLLLWKLGPVVGVDVSQIPGTITFQTGNYGIQIPVLFCVLTSVVLTLVMAGFRKLRG